MKQYRAKQVEVVTITKEGDTYLIDATSGPLPVSIEGKGNFKKFLVELRGLEYRGLEVVPYIFGMSGKQSKAYIEAMTRRQCG